ncbi:MAG: GNAT family N-acetyltransferase [Burkholderiales bacterium]
MTNDYTIEIFDWNRARADARVVRYAVFVVEQQVPVDLEWDEWDARSDHVLAKDAQGNPIGTARLLPNGHLGRMAVMAAWRGKGVGGALARALLRRADDLAMARVVLHAQTHAAGFYRKLGFAEFGDRFEEAGIAHIAMAIDLKRS